MDLVSSPGYSTLLLAFPLGIVALAVMSKHLFNPSKQPWLPTSGMMRGKTVIVTGASSGIGLEVAAELAQYGARVIMACRNLGKSEAVRNEIIDRLCAQHEIDRADLESRLVLRILDLASLESVRCFAAETLRTEQRLDVLVNNAAVTGEAVRELTNDGLELVMGTNYFGHFLLTNLLLPLLKRSAPSRVVVLGSMAYLFGRLDLNDLNSEKSYRLLPVMNVSTAYFNSKLALQLFAHNLASLLQHSDVTVTSMNPGVVVTPGLRLKLLGSLMNLIKRYLLKTAQQGAKTAVYLAASTSPEARVNGCFYSNCRPAMLLPSAKNSKLAKQLWEVSEKITHLEEAVKNCETTLNTI